MAQAELVAIASVFIAIAAGIVLLATIRLSRVVSALLEFKLSNRTKPLDVGEPDGVDH
jgi:hypothetical protein